MFRNIAASCVIGVLLGTLCGCSGNDSSGGDPSGSGSDSSGGGVNDPFADARAACLTKINALRASKSLSPYSRWQSAESCVDEEVTSDEKTGSAHGAWISGTYTCNGNAQNECEGQGPDGVASCLDSMWGEKDQAGCSGCDACADAYTASCPNCDFFGSTTGQVCGHYVNLSAKYLSQVACGFSSLGGWDAMNFE